MIASTGQFWAASAISSTLAASGSLTRALYSSSNSKTSGSVSTQSPNPKHRWRSISTTMRFLGEASAAMRRPRIAAVRGLDGERAPPPAVVGPPPGPAERRRAAEAEGDQSGLGHSRARAARAEHRVLAVAASALRGDLRLALLLWAGRDPGPAVRGRRGGAGRGRRRARGRRRRNRRD